jgi:hypothetical protein
MARVASDARVSSVLAGHQRAARRRADRAAGVILREAHAFSRQTVDVRRSESPLPVTAQIAVAQIVSLNEDDVGSGLRRKGRRKRDENNTGEDDCSSSHRVPYRKMGIERG